MARIALRNTADEAREDFPEAAQVLKDNTYMDDICDSFSTEEEARELTKCIDSVLEKGGFKVKGWLSNKATSNTDQEKRKETAILQGVNEEMVLGVVWNSHKDMFTLKLKPELLLSQQPAMLSNLSQVARIYDPIGFASAFLIRAKIGLQELWEKGVGWDEKLPSVTQEKWTNLFKEMMSLNGINLERCLTAPYAVGRPVLCVFSDASEDAFGSCAYARWQLSSGEYDVRFIAAKSRVAPLKRLTIPRLELQGAVLASRLCKTIVDESRFQFEKIILFLDSKIVLALIRSEARRFKPFVSVRVGEIKTNTDPSQWKHIPGEMNVADDVSRGIPVRNLVDRWQHGPRFLRLTENKWPQDSSTNEQPKVEEECLKVHNVCVQTKVEHPINCQKFSSWRNLVSYRLHAKANLKPASTTPQ